MRDKFLKVFEEFQAIKQLNNEKSFGTKEWLVKIFIAIVTKILVNIIGKYWKE